MSLTLEVSHVEIFGITINEEQLSNIAYSTFHILKFIPSKENLFVKHIE